MVLVRRLLRLRAAWCGVYDSRCAAAWARRRTSSVTLRLRFNARDTVATDTAASRATSLMLLVIAVSNSPGGTLAMECKRLHDDFKTRPTRSTQDCANFLYNPLIYI